VSRKEYLGKKGGFKVRSLKQKEKISIGKGGEKEIGLRGERKETEKFSLAPQLKSSKGMKYDKKTVSCW